MQAFNQRGLLFGIALLGILFTGLSSPASANPDRGRADRPRDANLDYRNDRISDRFDQGSRPGTKFIPVSYGDRRDNSRYDDRRPSDQYNRDRDNNYRDNRDNRDRDNRDRDNRDRDGRDDDWRHGEYRPDNGSYGGGYGRPGNPVHRSNLRGTIVAFRCPEDFDFRVGCEVYRVHPNCRTPRALSCGDFVEVNGDQCHGNDLDNANVSLLGNR